MFNHDTEKDFEVLSWHDNYIYGLHFSIEDFEQGDWRSDLAIDIDHIVDWVCETDGGCQFRVASATLTFHHVTDLDLAIDWGNSGFQSALHEISISHVSRNQIQNQKICLDRPYYEWKIATNFPKYGCLTFGASGFTQVLRAKPILVNEQKLPPSKRNSHFPPSV